jgi:hypothetical protein
MMQALLTRRLSTRFEVDGVEFSGPMDDEVVKPLWELFVNAGVLVFCGVGTTSAAHINLSRARSGSG